MITRLYCPDNARRALVRASALNGIDHLEVLDDEAPAGSPPQQTLLVHCFKSITGAGLAASNVRIDGGVRIRTIRVQWASAAEDASGLLSPGEQAFVDSLDDTDRILIVRTEQRGDLSTYQLNLIASPSAGDEPPAGFDVLMSAVDFSFKVECPSEFDCLLDRVCDEIGVTEPRIDYLAKDYASFKRLMLDRLAVTMPDWQERSPADLGVALVELLAYVGDYLSYAQDAAGGEAYLGTARSRISVRRHARLVDYFINDGCNARAWVTLRVEPAGGSDGAILPASTKLLDGVRGSAPSIPQARLEEALRARPIVFETLHDARLNGACNVITLHTWGDPHCCLLEGATQATLQGSANDLDLEQGDVLLFEEVLGEGSGLPADADPAKRHIVRLSTDPVELTDPVTGDVVLEIRWHGEDALPFSFCLKEFDDGSGESRPMTVARGNVILADAGLTISNEELSPPVVPETGRYRPVLRRTGLTHAAAYDDAGTRRSSAAAATRTDARTVGPQTLIEGEGELWRPQRDLLASDRFSTEFVAEMEDDGRAHIRFGEDILGRAPSPGASFAATYRVGNGSLTNVGAESLARVVTDLDGIVEVRNPFPATGGVDPEPIDRVRLHAPQAFRVQQRAVTEADYAEVSKRHPDVQQAAATRRWTGSWYTMFVTVDRRGGRPIDGFFEADFRAFLERFRLAGYDLEIDAPRFVPLDIVFTVCVEEGYLRSNVKRALLDVFSNRDLPSKGRGFFHPDNFTFGQPVYLSRMVATAMGVAGVAWIDTRETTGGPNRFRRWGFSSSGERAEGLIRFARLEIARLDNDPNALENGRIDFVMRGGL